MRIFLIGFMGSGKSHTGRQLSRRAGMGFIDLDDWIEKKENRSIRAVFEEDGEPYFRQIERDALREMARQSNVVISCGGGTPCFYDNMRWMNEHGVTIYLRASAEVLASRLAGQQAERPLLKGLTRKGMKKYIRSKLEERERHYMESSIVYEQRSAEEPVADTLLRHFQNLIGH